MKNLKFTFGAAMLVLAMSLTAVAKSGTISTTKTGTISTTKTGTISTTSTGTTSSSRAGTISTTRTGLISTTRNGSNPSLDRFRLFELLLTVLGPW